MGVGDVPAELVVGRLDGEAGRARRHDDRRDLAVAGPGGDGDQRGDVGAGVGDERLGAVDRPLAVVEHGAGLGGAGVRAGLGLGQAEAGERAAGDEVGQPLLLLLVGAVGQDRVDAEPDAGLEGDADRLVDAAELLDGDAERGEVAAAAAVLLGHDQAEQAELAHRVHDVDREVVLAVPLRDVRARPRARRSRARPCGRSRGPRTARRSSASAPLARCAAHHGLTLTSTSSHHSRRERRERASAPGRSASWPTSSASPPAPCASTRPRGWSRRGAPGPTGSTACATGPGCG